MTTKNSPLRILQAQADGIARMLKDADRGIVPNIPNADKLMAARANATVKFAIVMDDKVLTPEIEWTTVRGLSHNELARWIVRQMREETGGDH